MIHFTTPGSGGTPPLPPGPPGCIDPRPPNPDPDIIFAGPDEGGGLPPPVGL